MNESEIAMKINCKLYAPFIAAVGLPLSSIFVLNSCKDSSPSPSATFPKQLSTYEKIKKSGWIVRNENGNEFVLSKITSQDGSTIDSYTYDPSNNVLIVFYNTDMNQKGDFSPQDTSPQMPPNSSVNLYSIYDLDNLDTPHIPCATHVQFIANKDGNIQKQEKFEYSITDPNIIQIIKLMSDRYLHHQKTTPPQPDPIMQQVI